MNTKTVCIQNGNTESIKSLQELFYSYQPKIVIATPSPLILNGAEVDSKKIKVFKGENGYFSLQENETPTIEEIISVGFDD
jgi:hypothetical protein